MNNLDLLQQFISSKKFIDFLIKIDLAKFFELRDLTEFDSKWIENFNSLEKEKFSKEDINMINFFRENSFKTVFEICEDSEIASYISDDIEIIVKDMLLKNYESWSIKYLLKYYYKELSY